VLVGFANYGFACLLSQDPDLTIADFAVFNDHCEDQFRVWLGEAQGVRAFSVMGMTFELLKDNKIFLVPASVPSFCQLYLQNFS
jgi:hypothetical protein